MTELVCRLQYSPFEDVYFCSTCNQRIDEGDIQRTSLGVRNPKCGRAPVHPSKPEQKQDLPQEQVDVFADPAEEEDHTVSYRMLIGSDSRVGIQFSKRIEFYVMTAREAFELANTLLQAAYVSRERQEGILHPLGPKVQGEVQGDDDQAQRKEAKN